MIFALFILLALAPDGFTWDYKNPPKFEEFPIDKVFTGVPKAVDLSDPDDRKYRTQYRTQTRKGPNFAGHFTIVSWGCGSSCECHPIVDALTGKIYSGLQYDFIFYYQLNSNLVISQSQYNPPRGPLDLPPPYRYSIWRNHHFHLIFEDKYWYIKPNSEYKYGSAPFVYFAREGASATFLRELIIAGADIDSRDDDGMTAAMWVATNGDSDALRALVDAGADLFIKDFSGRTVVDHAFLGKQLNDEDYLYLVECYLASH